MEENKNDQEQLEEIQEAPVTTEEIPEEIPAAEPAVQEASAEVAEEAVAEAAAEAAGLPGLNASHMTAEAFTTIALLMGLCIMWGMLLSIFFNKKYLKKLQTPKAGGGTGGGFGDQAMTAMFIGLVSAYIGSYLGKFVSGNGLFTFSGAWLPLAVAAVAAGVMAIFVWLEEKKNAAWVDNFSIAGSMIAGMAAAVVLNGLL